MRLVKIARLHTCTLAFLNCFLFTVGAVAQAAGNRATQPVIFHAKGTSKRALRIEAMSPGVVRVWYSDSGRFVRKPSLALETAPRTHSPLTYLARGGEYLVSTSKMTIAVDPATLAVTVRDGSALKRGVQPLVGRIAMGPRRADGSWELTQSLFPSEHLLGLGQDNRNGGKLDRRGTIRELWAGQQINSGNVTAQYPIPFLLSTGRIAPGKSGHAYGVFFDNTYRLKYDLGKTKSDQLLLSAAGGDADFYILDGPTPKDVIYRYTEMTGRPSLPPLWALGYFQSRCVFWNWQDIDAAYAGLTSRGYPVDTMVIDYNWPEFMNDFVWDKRWTVNGVSPGTRVGGYRAKGVKIVMSNTGPMLKKDSPTYAPGWAKGVFATDGKGNPIQGGYFGGDILDFSSPAMNGWLWPQLEPRNKEGVAGWWLDLTEPEGEPQQATYHDGTSANIHNQFSMLVTRSFEGSELKDHPNRRPFILTRAGSAGIQSHHATLWSGDIYSDYATLAAHPAEMLNSGISGINWWTCDTGGFLSGFYKDDQFGAHARLYERWMQFSVFSPVTRAHKAGLCMPYEFGPATEQGTRKYLNLRYQLLPYIYSHAYEASQTGIPLVRALAIEFPNDPGSVNAPGDEYLFGKNLLVAPVLHEGASNRSVYFPPGQWLDWDYGTTYTGGRKWVVRAPQNRIPVAVRPGAIIPMAPPMANTQVGKWDPMTLEVFPSGASSFALYQDDGLTFDFQRGRSTTTLLTSDESGRAEKFEIRESNKLFAPKLYVVRFHLNRVPSTVDVDEIKQQLRWDAKARVLTVKVVAGAAKHHAVRVGLAGPVLADRIPPKLKADVFDAKGEVQGGGKPIPNFFPAPELPNRFKAVNYDKGGEGVAFHIGHAIATATTYRSDNAGVTPGSKVGGDDVGGGDVMAGLQRDDWLRYSINAGNGGFFDLVVRAKGQGGAFRLMSSDRNLAPAIEVNTGGKWNDVVVHNIYLDPGEDSLLLYVDHAGFALNSLEFRRPQMQPTIVEAEWGRRTGPVVVSGPDAGSNGGMKNIGQLQGSLSYGMFASATGDGVVRVRYANGGKAITIQLAVNGGSPMDVTLPNTGGGDVYKDIELKTPLNAGENRLIFSWKTTTYDSVTFDRLEVVR